MRGKIMNKLKNNESESQESEEEEAELEVLRILKKRKNFKYDSLIYLKIYRNIFNSSSGEPEYLTVYNDGAKASWQPRENFFDGDVGNEIFLEFEGNEEVDPEEKKAIKKSKNPPRTMSEASMAIYGHVNALADQSVSSSEIASSEDLKKFNHLIKTETKKDIRQSTIARREADGMSGRLVFLDILQHESLHFT
jgi:hypothetical protein